MEASAARERRARFQTAALQELVQVCPSPPRSAWTACSAEGKNFLLLVRESKVGEPSPIFQRNRWVVGRLCAAHARDGRALSGVKGRPCWRVFIWTGTMAITKRWRAVCRDSRVGHLVDAQQLDTLDGGAPVRRSSFAGSNGTAHGLPELPDTAHGGMCAGGCHAVNVDEGSNRTPWRVASQALRPHLHPAGMSTWCRTPLCASTTCSPASWRAATGSMLCFVAVCPSGCRGRARRRTKTRAATTKQPRDRAALRAGDTPGWLPEPAAARSGLGFPAAAGRLLPQGCC